MPEMQREVEPSAQSRKSKEKGHETEKGGTKEARKHDEHVTRGSGREGSAR